MIIPAQPLLLDTIGVWPGYAETDHITFAALQAGLADRHVRRQGGRPVPRGLRRHEGEVRGRGSRRAPVRSVPGLRINRIRRTSKWNCQPLTHAPARSCTCASTPTAQAAAGWSAGTHRRARCSAARSARTSRPNATDDQGLTATEWAGVRLSWGPLGLCVYASAGKVNGPILADGTVTS